MPLLLQATLMTASLFVSYLQGCLATYEGDRGYISQALSTQLRQTSGIHLVTKVRRKMKNRLIRLSDKLLLQRRGLIESVIDQLKNIAQIEHSRHRSPINFAVNLIAGLIAYCHQPQKPSLVNDAALPA